MNPDFLSVTFWFNIVEADESFVELFRANLKDEFTEYKFFEANRIWKLLIMINFMKMH